jgi:hypothetical protein
VEWSEGVGGKIDREKERKKERYIDREGACNYYENKIV